MKRTSWLICLALIAITWAALAQDRPTKVRQDKSRVEAAGFWIYNDLERGIAEAKKTGKPLLVVFRCIPCEACAKIDEQVAERDATIRDLLDRFVCVRIVHANGMDLSLFQFDYDQSWAAFFLNADMTIYGRYGTRSHQTESDDDVSVEGFGKSLAAALEVHKEYPKNRAALAGKRGPASAVKVPEDLATLKGKYGPKIDYEGKVVQSCIHCHQVGEALRHIPRAAGKPVPDQVLYPHPNPKSLGLIMDPKEKARVKEVTPRTPGAVAGFQAGDDIMTLAGQPILSTADVQWVLHNAGETAELLAEVQRGGKKLPLTLKLGKDWRRRSDISWRATSWELRRMATGGLVFEDLDAERRRGLGLSDDALALRIKHVGQYGAHAAGKNAGFRQDDVVIDVDARTGRMSESDLIAFLINEKKAGQRVPVTVLRGGEKVKLMLPMQ